MQGGIVFLICLVVVLVVLVVLVEVALLKGSRKCTIV